MFAWSSPSKKSDKPLSDAEKRKQARNAAQVLINENRMKIRKPLDTYYSVAKSNYWQYGYMLGSMMALVGVSMSIGSRLPLVARYGSWVALVGGYFGGAQLHNLHKTYLLVEVSNVIDNDITEMTSFDEKYGGSVPDYADEIKALKKMKVDLVPQSNEAKEAATAHAATAGMSLDDRANALIQAFEEKKKQVTAPPTAR